MVDFAIKDCALAMVMVRKRKAPEARMTPVGRYPARVARALVMSTKSLFFPGSLLRVRRGVICIVLADCYTFVPSLSPLRTGPAFRSSPGACYQAVTDL